MWMVFRWSVAGRHRECLAGWAPCVVLLTAQEAAELGRGSSWEHPGWPQPGSGALLRVGAVLC